jgi:serine/threonine-protein kinase HipA
MLNKNYISVICFGQEIGRLSMDDIFKKSYFQYNEIFLSDPKALNLFPETGILKKTNQVQVFSTYEGATFRGLPPMFADSLPDDFGNLMFNQFLKSKNTSLGALSPLEQLTYVANRGMGALEYQPAIDLKGKSEINLTEIIEILNQIIFEKREQSFTKMDNENLLNIFKIGTSAGGVRPKVILSEEKSSGKIYAGDLYTSDKFKHYIVKLDLEEREKSNQNHYFPREKVEYAYYLTAKSIGIKMMDSKLIDDRHFATQRFDRVGGKKKHILTASGLTGWDYKNPQDSSYENLFNLAVFLGIPKIELAELFLRMVFNIIFANTDDHLKNHSFILDEKSNSWHLAPAYDLTFAINPFLNYSRVTRAMSVNGKRENINLKDIMKIGETYQINETKIIIDQIKNAVHLFEEQCIELNVNNQVINKMKAYFIRI